jgi:hypothetical protein
MNNVAKLRLTPSVAQQRIRKISAESSNVILSKHAKERMNERSILRADIDRTLRGGYIEGNPEQTEEGDWKCKMTLPIKGLRDLGVVVILLHSGKLFVMTVEWEDPR